jgi:hypothetical protein
MNVQLPRQRVFDAMAIAASAACLVHCLLLPALLVLLPTLAAFLAVPEALHLWALAFALPTSAVALVAGYRRHRRAAAPFYAAAGLALLAAGVFVAENEWMETALTVPGALALALGHAVNWRAARHIS